MALGELLAGLGVNTRVLMIGAHPDDEDTNLITWLQRGRGVETAYLSLTRGDGGQNIIGNQLGEALGVIRTEELLAARRIDGAQQYFTRAFDFGFSKDTIDTFRHWQRDSILGDVVRVVRSFRPHVIVAVFSGTPRDGHGHHQVSGLLARAAYDGAGDSLLFRPGQYGSTWSALKFYRAARGNQQNGTLGMDVGEYSALLGRSYGEIAGESRSQHKSQGFGALERKGPIMNYVRREASRVNESSAPNSERSLFDGIDTSWTRFAIVPGQGRRATLSEIPERVLAARAAFDAFAPGKAVAPLRRLRESLERVCSDGCRGPGDIAPDLATSAFQARQRVDRALALALGVTVEVTANRDVLAVGRRVNALATVYNRGSDTVSVSLEAGMDDSEPVARLTRSIPPGGVTRDSIRVPAVAISAPNWLQRGRVGDMFPGFQINGLGATVPLSWSIGSIGRGWFHEPVTVISVDQVKGEVRQRVDGVPLLSVTLGSTTEYLPAATAIDRDIVVQIKAADDSARMVRVSLALPRGLIADSGTRTVGVQGGAVARFRVRGRLAAGSHHANVLAEYAGVAYSSGYSEIGYEHITRQFLYRPASLAITAVDVTMPTGLRVAYVPGGGDNIAPSLAQLGVPVTVIPAAEIARADLSSFSTVVIGPRAYDAHPELLAANPKLFDFARKGGVLMVQYGQYEMTQPGATPFPITINRPHDRVTLEDAPVTIDAPGARELTYPNRISAADFDGWVQERGLYMPRTFDPAYRALLSMNDPNEPANRGAVLVAPLGDGLYIYTSLSFFRQLPAGVPGAARLFVNLLSARPAPRGATP